MDRIIPTCSRRAADFVDKILRALWPSTSRSEQPTKFDLVINLTTAKRRARSGRRGDRITDLLLRRGRPLLAGLDLAGRMVIPGNDGAAFSAEPSWVEVQQPLQSALLLGTCGPASPGQGRPPRNICTWQNCRRGTSEDLQNPQKGCGVCGGGAFVGSVGDLHRRP